MEVDAGTIFGPPVTTFPDPTPEAIVHRLAVYEDGDVSAEVRLFDVDLSRWPHETLLASAGVPVETSRVTAGAVDGVTYTCARMRRGSACVWTDGSCDRLGTIGRTARRRPAPRPGQLGAHGRDLIARKTRLTPGKPSGFGSLSSRPGATPLGRASSPSTGSLPAEEPGPAR